jgi:hypothetical protein
MRKSQEHFCIHGEGDEKSLYTVVYREKGRERQRQRETQKKKEAEVKSPVRVRLRDTHQ